MQEFLGFAILVGIYALGFFIAAGKIHGTTHKWEVK